jgi:penicillin amidase
MAELDELDVSLHAIKDGITIKRNEYGVPVVRAKNLQDMLFGLGWVQAYDRPVQLELTRLVAKGVASEHLPPSPDLIRMDKEMRRYDLWGYSTRQAMQLDGESEGWTLDFCRGINECFKEHQPPEFGMLGYVPEEWKPADCILMCKIISLVDMDETQGWIKRLIVQMFQEGITIEQLKELFVYMTDEPSEEYLEVLRQVKLPEPFVPESIKWSVPRMQSSSNWAVSGSKTNSGEAIFCGSPDLDTARLPAIWQEVVLHADDYFIMGFTVPGLMGVPVGRTNHLAWSPTFGCMDIMAYFLEEVKGGKYRRGEEWVPFEVREETIAVKDAEPLKVLYYENEHGVLMGEPEEDGYYLCLAWSMRDAGAGTIENFMPASRSKGVSEAMGYLSRLDFGAFNWVLADIEGNIGYQMSGVCPIRPMGWSGLLPIPGWDAALDWRGHYGPECNPRLYNPLEGFVGTANQDVNDLTDTPMQTLPMAADRSLRIAELLDARDDHDLGSMKDMQYDVYAKQAERFMPIIRPLLPDTENGKLLGDWDMLYSSDSLGATLFESVYRELLKVVFGDNGLGREVISYLMEETILLNLYYGHFDQVMQREDSLWFGGKPREEIYRLAITRGLDTSPVPYGSTHMVTMKNIVFGEMTPDFDYGPIEIRGCRGTLCQGQIFKSAGRLATFSPTCRMIVDFALDKSYTALAGGPSERPASPWYSCGVQDWLDGDYHVIEP